MLNTLTLILASVGWIAIFRLFVQFKNVDFWVVMHRNDYEALTERLMRCQHHSYASLPISEAMVLSDTPADS